MVLRQPSLMSTLLLKWLIGVLVGYSSSSLQPVVLIKVGGSSITNKAIKETLDPTAIAWFTKTVAHTRKNQTFVLVHGAGSFGHFTAKEYGLAGKTEPPPIESERNETCNTLDTKNQHLQLQGRLGLSLTRLSVQKLNRAVVESLVEKGVPAVSLSPCFGVPGMQAHGGDAHAQKALLSAVYDTLQAGLIPVLHGDACLYGSNGGGVGILSGDTLMKILGSAPWVSRAIFLTDVDGVFTADPRVDASAVMIPRVTVGSNGELWSGDRQKVVEASGSQHVHDVTGGFKTKLDAASSVVASGKVVAIAKCASPGAEAVIRSPNLLGTTYNVTYLIPSES